MGQESPIVLALDTTDRVRALEVVEKTRDHLAAVKIGWPALLSLGKGFITEIRRMGIPVIADLKLADIDNTIKLIVDQVLAAGAEYVIGQPFVGKQSYGLVNPKKLILVVEMSHPGALEYIQGHTEAFCKMAKELGVHGIVAPATRPERVRQIREWVGPDIKIYSPGVGAQGGSGKDVLAAGANYIIVGRTIYGDKEPGKAVKKVLDSLK
ncbi:MAG: orotidine-5'-phosphate decarboxylase [archaeon]